MPVPFQRLLSFSDRPRWRDDCAATARSAACLRDRRYDRRESLPRPYRPASCSHKAPRRGRRFQRLLLQPADPLLHLPIVEAETAADDFFHDFRGAREDTGDARIGVHAADAVLLHIAGATVQLHAVVHHAAFEFGGEQLGFRRYFTGQFAGHQLHCALIDEALNRVDLGAHARHFETRVLECTNRFAEGFAGGDVLHGDVETDLRRSHRTDRRDQTLARQALRQIGEALGRIAEYIGFRHFDIVEKQLGGVLRFQAELLQAIAALKAFHAVFDHEQAHGVLRLGVGARRHHHQIGELAVGNVGFRAVQQPVIAHVYRSGLHAGEIGASAGLGHRHCENFLAGDAGRQPALFLLVGAEFIDIRRDQAGVQIDVEADIAVADVLFDDDLLEAEVIDAGSAVFLVGPQHQITLLAGLGVGPAVDITLLAPFLRVRADLVLEEAAYRAAKIVVFGFKYRSLHDSQLSNMGTRCTDALPQTQACAGPRNASKFARWRQHFTGDDRIHQSARDFRVETLAARGALAQPGRWLVARAIGFRHAIAFGDEFRSADHIDVRQRTAGPARKAPRQQRTDIAVGSMREYSLFEAARFPAPGSSGSAPSLLPPTAARQSAGRPLSGPATDTSCHLPGIRRNRRHSC